MAWFWFWMWLICTPLAFAAGGYVNAHPNETRTFLERVRAAAGRLIHRDP